MDTFEVIAFIIVFVSILFLSYIATKFIAGRSNKLMKSKHIKVVESISLGMDKRLLLVKAGEQHYLLTATSKSIGMIDKVEINPETEEVYSTAINNTENSFDFASILHKYTKSIFSGKQKDIRQQSEKPTVKATENSRFRQNLEKLRSIAQKKNLETQKSGVIYTNEKKN